MTRNNRLLLTATAGFGAIVAGLLLFSKKASAATNPNNPSTPTLDPNSAQGQAATALAAAIQAAGGYSASETGLVKAYEQAAPGLNVDAGYPGQNVMASLRNDLNAMGTASQYPLVMSIATYPWTTAGGWTAGNVPAAFVGGSAWTGTTVGT